MRRRLETMWHTSLASLICLLGGLVQGRAGFTIHTEGRKISHRWTQARFACAKERCEVEICRRDAISVFAIGAFAPYAAQAWSDVRPRTSTIRLNTPNERAGLEIREVSIGSPPKGAVAVEGVSPGGAAARAGVQPGMVLLKFSDSKSVSNLIRNGPYPIELEFYNLASGGDAFGDMGKPLVTAEDALATSKSLGDSSSTTTSSKDQDYVVRVVKRPDSSCGIQSRRGDVLEINYEARYGGPEGRLYDASSQRGTGQPYQLVLGSGDQIPGVDQGLYDMCPGESRQLEIPPSLGYGPRARGLYGIPDGSRLYWNVELVSVNSVLGGDERTREELEGRVP